MAAQEMIARGRVRRVLILCPASLQQQWQDEMRQKFNLPFEIINCMQWTADHIEAGHLEFDKSKKFVFKREQHPLGAGRHVFRARVEPKTAEAREMLSEAVEAEVR